MAETASAPSLPRSIDWSSLPSDLSPFPVDWRLAHGNRDIYYRRAKESGYRARSAYKLLQLDAAHSVFTPTTQRVVDLCAAPGSWSQVAAERLALSSPAPSVMPRVIAVDLQEMSPISGVHLMQGDVTSEATMRGVLDYFGGAKVDLVLCDGAPDVTGLHVIDEYVQGQLLESCPTRHRPTAGTGRHLRGQDIQTRRHTTYCSTPHTAHIHHTHSRTPRTRRSLFGG